MTRLIVFLLLLASPAFAAVTAIDIDNPSRVGDAEILRVFKPRVGDDYDPAEVRRSLQFLLSMPGVQNVLVRTREEPGGTRIALQVLAEPLVRDVLFKGSSLFSDRELAEGLRVKPDVAANAAILSADADALRQRYAAEGYPEARIATEFVPTHSPHWQDVRFTIQDGPPLRVTGYGDLGEADRFGRERFLDLLDMEKGEIASEKRLREGTKNLLKECREEGYPEARMLKAWFERAPEGATLSALFSLGRKTRVEVEGFDSDDLTRIMEDRLGETMDEEWAQSTARRMKDWLVEDGYGKAEVVPEEEVSPGGERLIVFRVAPGVQETLAGVRFEGNVTATDSKLLNLMQADDSEWLSPPPLRRKVLQSDIEILKQYYALEGFIRVEVSLRDIDVSPDGRAVATIAIREGERHRLRDVSFEIQGTDKLTAEEALKISGLVSGEVATPARVEKARVLLLADLAKRGYSEASVDQDASLVPDRPLVDVRYKVLSGPFRRVGTIYVSGNSRTNTETILREVTLKPGEPWNLQEALLSRQRISRLGFFQDVQIAPVGEPRADGSTDIQISVKEQNAGRVDYGVGYGTEEGPTAFLEIGHSNLMGSGRSLSLRIDLERDNRAYALNFREPHILATNFDLRLSLINRREEREAYVLHATAFQASLDRELLDSLRASLLYTLEENRLSDVEPGAIIVDQDDEPYLLSSLGPFVVWDSRDDPFNPKTGFHHSFQTEWASDVIGSDVNFVKYIAMMSAYATVDRFTLGVLARGGIADLFGRDPNLPVNKRFFLGGRSTVRGFGRDQVGPKAADGTPIGGDAMANLKAELRFPIYRDFGMALFWDAGQVWIREQDKIQWGDLRHGVGGGFRYNTPVGPIALDVGFKVNRQDDERPYEWHFTIGNVF